MTINPKDDLLQRISESRELSTKIENAQSELHFHVLRKPGGEKLVAPCVTVAVCCVIALLFGAFGDINFSTETHSFVITVGLLSALLGFGVRRENERWREKEWLLQIALERAQNQKDEWDKANLR